MRNGGATAKAVGEAMDLQSGSTNAYWVQYTATMDPRGSSIELDVIGVPNTDPSTAGHFVAIWQAQGTVPWTDLAGALVGKQNVALVNPDGTVPFIGLSLGQLPYVLGYSTGPDATTFNNLAAVMPFGVGGTPGQLQATTLVMVSVGATGLTVDYTTPDGSEPNTQGHSLALVKDDTFFPGRSKVIATASTTDSSKDSASFDLSPTPLQSGQSYTVAYLTGQMKDPNNQQNLIPDPKTVAATLEFTVA